MKKTASSIIIHGILDMFVHDLFAMFPLSKLIQTTL